MRITEKQKYLAISDMLLTTTMLSNEFCPELDEDALKIVNFIGKSLHLSEEEIQEIGKLILDDLTMISTVDDVNAYQSSRVDENFPSIKDMLYMKSLAVEKLENIHRTLSQNGFNQFFFDYNFLRPYFRDIRFKELEIASAKGNVDINRTVGILLANGIGCEKDIKAAIYRLRQCAFWGDVSSISYLAYLYEEIGDEKNKKLFSELAKLEKHLLAGRTVIPNDEEAQFDELTKQTFVIISSIKQDIVLAFNIHDIDYSFVEVIEMEKLDYYKKLAFINEYRNQEWKEVTNSSSDPSKRLGFNVKGAN